MKEKSMRLPSASAVRTLGTALLTFISLSAAHAVTPQVVSGFVDTAYMLRADGSLWALNKTTSAQVATGVEQVSGSDYYAYALMANGTVYALSSRGDGLGNTVGNGFSAISGTIGLKSDGTLWNLESGAQIGTAGGFVRIWGFDYTNFASKADGSLWAWGGTLNGQFGDGTVSESTLTTPKQIGTAYADIISNGNSFYGLKSDGSLWAWGVNADGQLGTGTPKRCASYNYTLCEATAKQIGTGFAQVAAGSNFAMGIKTDGTLWNWGFNDGGQLGTDNNHYATTPQKVGSGYAKIGAGYVQSFAIKTDGTLWAWGDNRGGYLGANDPQNTNWEAYYVPYQIDSGYTNLWVGTLGVVAMKDDGSVWTWGMRFYETKPTQHLESGLSSSVTNSADCLFNWAEQHYSDYLSPAGATSATAGDYRYRYYSGSHAYLAAKGSDFHLYYLTTTGNGTPADLGNVSDWLSQANCQ
jgi:alpha-tubulin suppressor-like RCC1 family protein